MGVTKQKHRTQFIQTIKKLRKLLKYGFP